MRIYIAGKMAGMPRFNFELFATAAELLRANGHTVLSPAEATLAEGFDPDNPGPITPKRYEAWMKRALAMIDTCEAVCFLFGWEESEGARREWAYARMQGKKTLSFCRGPAENWWRYQV